MKIEIKFFGPGGLTVTWQQAHQIKIKVDDTERRELLAAQTANTASQQAALEELWRRMEGGASRIPIRAC